jgi:hypothetical protein
MKKVQVVIPFRDRGLDMNRAANLEIVMAWWWAHGLEPKVVDDGLAGDAQFNRHKAYNRAVAENPEADIFVFTEADMLIPIEQINLGLRLTTRHPGLVVPFMRYLYMSKPTTEHIRDTFHDASTEDLAKWIGTRAEHPASMFQMNPESTMEDGSSIGAVNIVSRETLDLTGGFTEATSGNWYDDRIIEEGWSFLTGHRTSHVPGPALHLYHLPGWTGDHLTDADKRATRNNRDLLVNMRADIRMGHKDKVKDLMEVRA